MVNGGGFRSSERTKSPETVSCMVSTAKTNEMNNNVDNNIATV